jgi:hypothetical protein
MSQKNYLKEAIRKASMWDEPAHLAPMLAQSADRLVAGEMTTVVIITLEKDINKTSALSCTPC